MAEGTRSAWVPAIALAILLAGHALAGTGLLDLRLVDGRLVGGLAEVLDRSAPLLVASLGMALVVATGGIDLSVGSVMALAGAVAGTLLAPGRVPADGAGGDWAGAGIALAAALGAGLAAGLFNGWLVAGARLPPIVATLVLMVAGRGAAQLVTGGRVVPLPAGGVAAWLARGSVLGLPAAALVAAAIAGGLGALAHGTRLRLFVRATGANARAARLAGVPTRATRLVAYAACGGCAALAGLLATADIGAADGNATGLYLELDAILAVVLGGNLLTGGRLQLAGTACAAVLLQAATTTILMARPGGEELPVEATLAGKAALVLLVGLAGAVRRRGVRA